MGPEISEPKARYVPEVNEDGGSDAGLQKLYSSANLLYNNSYVSPREVDELIDQFGDESLPSEVHNGTHVLKGAVDNFTLPTSVLVAKIGCSVDELLKINNWIQKSRLCMQTMSSNFFPGYLSVGYAASFYSDLVKNPSYLNKVLNGESVAPKRLEIHSTHGNCNYKCEMCLWRVKDQAHYGETEKRLLTKDD